MEPFLVPRLTSASANRGEDRRAYAAITQLASAARSVANR
jgi:hypothetical protein